MLDAESRGERAEFAGHHAWLLRLARRLARDEAEAEDLVQDAWTQLLRRGTGAVRDLRAFLGGIVGVLARRERAARVARGQREGRAVLASHEVRGAELPATDVLVERLELARVLTEELACLPESQRTLLLLHHQEGVSLAVIARQRGLPPGTIRSQITRARAALRAGLDRRFGGEREGWAVIALARLPAQGFPGREAALAGGMTMQLSAKLALGVAALAALLWFGWRARSETEAIPLPLPPVATVLEAAPAPEIERESEAESPARTPVVAQEPGTPARTFRIRVLDAFDDAPLAHFALRVRSVARGAASDEVVASDAAGELTLDRIHFAPPLEVLALDDAENPLEAAQEQRIEREQLPATGEALELRFRAGPTYGLDFTEAPPSGAEIELSLRPGLEPDLGFGYRGWLRGDEPPWTRFDPNSALVAELGTGPWTLTARDRGGLWLAWSEVRQIAGAQAEPVVLRGGARGALSIAATIGGAPIESILSARLFPMVDGGCAAEYTRRLTLYPASRPGFPGSGGHGPITCVEPGEYQLRIGSQSYPDLVEDVHVVAGEITTVAVDVPLRTDLAALEVRVRSQTGRATLLGLAVHARDPRGVAAPQMASLREARADGSVLYAFEALPGGEWEIELEPPPDLAAWDRTRVRAAAGGPAIEFLCLDEAQALSARLRVRVVDAATGAPLAAVGIRTFLGHEAHRSSSTDADGVAWIGPYAEGSTVEVHARAGGYVGALVESRMQADGGEPLSIALERGWGGLFEIVEFDGQRESRLANVRLVFDGVPVATTDELGRALVRAAQRPARVEVVREGYRVADYGDLDATSGALRAQEQYSFRIALRRTP